jgi:hypothetical protein
MQMTSKRTFKNKRNRDITMSIDDRTVFIKEQCKSISQREKTMKRTTAILSTVVFLTAIQFANASADIGFSTDEGGLWRYEGSVFSFHQPVSVDLVQGATSDVLVGAFVELPEFEVTSFIQVLPGIYQGTIAPAPSQIVIRDGGGQALLTGELGTGGLFTIGSTASMYPEIQADITITGLAADAGSVLIQSYNLGDLLDFDLTLQSAGTNLGAVIASGGSYQGDTFSGSMTLIPEPATMILLGLGGLLLRRQQ